MINRTLLQIRTIKKFADIRRWLNVKVYRENLNDKSKGAFSNCPIPEEIKNLNENEINKFASGLYHYAAIINGLLYTWGSNEYGQLGPTNTGFNLMDSGSEQEDLVESPFLVPGAINSNNLEDNKEYDLAAGDFHTICLDKNLNNVWSWGAGILGRGAEVYDPMPATLNFFKEANVVVNKVYAAGDYSVAIATPESVQHSGRQLVYLWGYLPNTKSKAYYPVLVEELLNDEIYQLNCNRNGFLTLSRNKKDDNVYLKWFGGLDNELEDIPYYPNYNEEVKVLSTYSANPSFSAILPKSIVNGPSDIIKIISGGNGIAGLLLKNNKLIMIDLKNNDNLDVVVVNDVDSASMSFNFLISKSKLKNISRLFKLSDFKFSSFNDDIEIEAHNQNTIDIEGVNLTGNELIFSGDKILNF